VKALVAEEGNGFRLTPQELDSAITPRTKVFIINTPGNPSSHAYTREQLKALADVVVQHPQVVVLSDEIYEKLVSRTLTINCHSKTYSMTGWRVGYIGGPKHVIEAINRLVTHMISHIPSFIQPAALAALTDPRGPEWIESMRLKFQERAHHMHQRLTSLPGITCVRPQGAFYCFPNISACFGRRIGDQTVTDATSFAAALLEHAHVAVVPGNESGFATHVRLSFATSREQIDTGLDRIEKFLCELS
jgi:aspartate aminotransferase